MIRSKLWLCVILACAAAPPPAAGVKLAGKVLDAAALGNVKTYGVDTNNLNGPARPGDLAHPQAMDVRELIKTESGPKGLLSELPWKLEADCSAPGVDAILRFDFRTIQGIVMVKPVPPDSAPGEWPPPLQFRWRAQLQVSDKASSRVIYKAEGNPLDYHGGPTAITQVQLDPVQRRDAADHALSALVSDVKPTSKNP